MKIKMIVAADTALALTVSAPRRTRFKHVGGKWKALQRKRALEYKRNKTKILQKARQYRKKNAAKLKQRAAFLDRQPKRAVKTIMSAAKEPVWKEGYGGDRAKAKEVADRISKATGVKVADWDIYNAVDEESDKGNGQIYIKAIDKLLTPSFSEQLFDHNGLEAATDAVHYVLGLIKRIGPKGWTPSPKLAAARKRYVDKFGE